MGSDSRQASQAGEGIGGVFGAMGHIADGNAAMRSAEYNARIDHVNARYTREQGAYEANLAEVEGQKAVGQMIANYAANGVTLSGSVFDVIEESSRNSRMDVLNIRLQADRQARGLDMSGEQRIREGKMQRKASRFAAGAEIAKSGAKAATMGAGG